MFEAKELRATGTCGLFLIIQTMIVSMKIEMENRMKRFPSVRKNREFQDIYKHGTSYANRLLVMYVMESGEDGNRIGISVSRKVGNSIVHHHITRLLREIFRLNNSRIRTELNIIVVARVAAKKSDYKDLEGAYLHLCGLHHILKESK